MHCRIVTVTSTKPGSQQKTTNLHFRGEVSSENTCLFVPSLLITVISVKWYKRTSLLSSITTVRVSETTNVTFTGLTLCTAHYTSYVAYKIGYINTGPE